jgi:hypothetical protein
MVKSTKPEGEELQYIVRTISTDTLFSILVRATIGISTHADVGPPYQVCAH